jgi:hypothetical protein
VSSHPSTGPAAHTASAGGGTPAHPSTPHGPRRRRLDHLGLISAIAGILGVLIAVAAWWWPQAPSGSDHGADGTSGTTPQITTSTTGAATTAPAGAGAATGGPAADHLDSDGISAESGGSYLVSLPRAVRAKAGWSQHPIAIACPSNQTGDEAHDVTYVLHGHYVQFDATVRPWLPPGTDTRAGTWVTVLSGVTQTDGQLVTTEVGRQQQATMSGPKPVSATIDKAEKLTLRVQCSDPNGIVVLSDARLTPA